MIADEKILLRQLKEGSHQAFQRLYESYFDMFYGFIFRLTRSHGLTTEVVQIAFSKVWNSHTRIVPEESFKAWLFKIGKNEVINAMKKQWNDPLFVDFLSYCETESMSPMISINSRPTWQWQSENSPLDNASFLSFITNRGYLLKK